MKEIYVHTLRLHFYGRGNRKSRFMFPVSYGPFRDEDDAREWIRQSGITCATKLMGAPATENVKVPSSYFSIHNKNGLTGFVGVQEQQNIML